jgi:hypothetical protein
MTFEPPGCGLGARFLREGIQLRGMAGLSRKRLAPTLFPPFQDGEPVLTMDEWDLIRSY